jgi:cephalosporin-C deacetylase-like acetyl esterase
MARDYLWGSDSFLHQRLAEIGDHVTWCARSVFVLGVLARIAWGNAAAPPAAVVSPDHADGIYAVGDTVHWTITWKGDGAAPADAKYVLESGGLKDVGAGTAKFDRNVAHFDSTFDAPNTMLAVVTWESTGSSTVGGGARANRAVGGAVADPSHIQPAAPEPADFDAFWAGKLRDLRTVPPNPQLTPADSGKAGVSYAKLTLDNIGGTHVQGQVARPETGEKGEKGEKFPAILIPQWAGVYALQKSWVTDRAAGGWLAVNLEAHDIPIDNPAKFYTDLYGKGGALQNYWKIGNEDRDNSYYVRMYLSACQCVEYLKTRPDWDGKTLVIMGASQGGQQSLVVGGLYPGTVTAVLAMVPAACDNLAPGIGRAAGFPNWWAQTDSGRDAGKIHETSKYFDPVYFARRIRCPVLVGLGLRDETAAPSSIFAAVNQITSPKEVVVLATSGHQDEQGSQEPYNDLANKVWLAALVKGEVPPISK